MRTYIFGMIWKSVRAASKFNWKTPTGTPSSYSNQAEDPDRGGNARGNRQGRVAVVLCGPGAGIDPGHRCAAEAVIVDLLLNSSIAGANVAAESNSGFPG